MCAKNVATGLMQPAAGTPEADAVVLSAPSTAPLSTLAYADFAAALKGALRDFHSPDLLARNPLLHQSIGNPGRAAGPEDLKALLSATVSTLFDNPRDERLRRIIELTYFQPALKQEVVADRLALSFGTYRRHLAAARSRMTDWLWESVESTQRRPVSSSSSATVAGGKNEPKDEPTTPRDVGTPAAPRLSVVILPFVNIGGSAGDDRLANGITETLTTDLSRISGVFVISRSTAYAYKDKSIDARQIGRELGVRYVLEGSVQNTRSRTRINAQLVDAASGAHLWAERFDKQGADLLDVQDEITTRLVRNVHIELIAVESRRVAREDPNRRDAVDHTLCGRAAWNQHLSLEAARYARHFFEAALRLDGQNVDALLGVANAHMWGVHMYASDDRAGQIRVAEAMATAALGLAPDSAEAHVTYGTVLNAMRRPERALREFKLAIGLDAKLPTAHALLGLTKVFLGRASDTRAHVEEAMRLSPLDPLLFHWHFFIAVADIHLGRVVHALESLRKSVEINPNWGLSQFVLAGALALAGLLAEAAEVCALARRLAPNFTISEYRAEAVSDNAVYLALRDHFCEGLRLAGVPEN